MEVTEAGIVIVLNELYLELLQWEKAAFLIVLSVVDNGHGFDSQNIQMWMGINNMRIRLSAFGGCMDINSELEKGTEVNIELDI